MEIIKGKIGNALTSVAENHVVAVAGDIYDEKANMYQSKINEKLAAENSELASSVEVLNNRTEARNGQVMMSAERLNAGESMSVELMPILTPTKVVLNAAIDAAFNGINMVVGGASITIAKEEISVVISEKQNEYTLDWDDFDGDFFREMLTVEVELLPAVGGKAGRYFIYLMVKSNNNVNEFCIGEAVLDMNIGFAVSVWGVLVEPTLSVEQKMYQVVCVLDYADRMQFPDIYTSIIGFSGITSTRALTLFKEAINLGRPEVAVWFVGVNEVDDADGVEVYEQNLTAFIEECKQNGVTPVLCTVPNTPGSSNVGKNDVIRSITDVELIVDIAAIINGGKSGNSCPQGFWDESAGAITDDGVANMYFLINSNI